MNYAEIVEKNGYFVDKTRYIEKLETIQNPIFLRPRRFGKSLFCSMLQHYYDLRDAEKFDNLFGHTWIGQHPTGHQNKYIVLLLDFSEVQVEDGLKGTEQNFTEYCNNLLNNMRLWYPEYLSGLPHLNVHTPVATNLTNWLTYLRMSGAPPVYIIIDEYDNFVNQFITTHQDHLYQEITSGDSFLRAIYKVLKAGRRSGAVKNIFITGVLPITIDDLTSSFNIATFLTLDSSFEHMLGFTQSEVNSLLDLVYQDYMIDSCTRSQVDEVIKSQYNGYHFVDPEGEAVYNSTMLMFFLREFSEKKVIPKHLTDLNLRTDLSWVKRITSTIENTEEIVSELITTNNIAYDDDYLVSKFNKSQFFDKEYYPILLFYLGMLTKKDQFLLTLPNLNMQKIFAEYFNELYSIDVSTRYAPMMQKFIDTPDLAKLYEDYWRLYISQLPEAIFDQVNENFYRTTFYELCSRYLSTWFTWNIERSYPQGRSDLEFVGKYHEKFADLRWVIEFKYYSNTKWSRLKTSIEAFHVQEEDTRQIEGYAQGLTREYPKADIRLFVIYCIGNQGFRVFEVKKPQFR
jgi:hypothetical protein